MDNKDKLLKVQKEINKILKDNQMILYPDMDSNIVLEISETGESIVIS